MWADVVQPLGRFRCQQQGRRAGRYDYLSPLSLHATRNQQTLRTISESRVKEGSIGAYLENTVQWREWLRTTAGLRYDRYRFDVDSNIAENSGKVSAGTTSPKFSVVLGPWAKTEFFVNYGEGFHSNDARGTTVHLTPKERNRSIRSRRW
jgi:outer membrane receptor protein involved in Fe transport